MLKIGIVVGTALLVAIIIVLVIVDVATMPPATTSACVLKRNYILPDQCVTSCTGAEAVCTVSTRPYLIFWTQAAGCADGLICGGSK